MSLHLFPSLLLHNVFFVLRFCGTECRLALGVTFLCPFDLFELRILLSLFAEHSWSGAPAATLMGSELICFLPLYRLPHHCYLHEIQQRHAQTRGERDWIIWWIIQQLFFELVSCLLWFILFKSTVYVLWPKIWKYPCRRESWIIFGRISSKHMLPLWCLSQC